MKHRSFLILCFLGMCMPIILGMAEPAQNVPAVIDGENADRVHLRAGPSVQSKSLGIYFTGTELLCASDPTQDEGCRWLARRVHEIGIPAFGG